ncbi:MAG: alpha/beta hydrolase family protein [Planctomycetota bacterium]|jgi:pimeloyl-ACP methyl ester carboxylesterase
MRTTLCAVLLAIGSLLPAALAQDPAPAPAPGIKILVGTWEGFIPAGPQKLLTVFHLEPDGEGGLTGTVDSPEQRAFGLPLSDVALAADGTVTITVALTGAVYTARLDEDGKHLRGTWRQRGAELPLECVRTPEPPPLPAELREKLAGVWEGVLEVGAVELRLVFHLRPRTTGALGGAMDSPDQGVEGLTITRVDFLGEQQVRIAIGSVGATFEATMDESGTLAGTYRQGGVSLSLDLHRVEVPTVVRRPQTPEPPFPYRQEEVTYVNAADGVTLAGTLTLPEGSGPFSAALLITGSGPQDRDESVFQHRPFLVIADHLTRAGVAVLRVDDRGVGGSTAGSEPATTADFADDVRAGVAFLRTRPEIAPHRIGLIGHSEGGIIAPMVASTDEAVAFVVLLAGTGLVGEQILYLQGELIGRASGLPEEMIAANRRTQQDLFAIVKDDDLAPAEARKRMTAVLEADENLPAGEQREGVISVQLAQLESAWLRFFIQHDPGPVLQRVRCPVLALNGTLDLQVPWEENLEAIREALQRGGNEDATVMELPGLNHLFQHAETGLVTEYGHLEETFSVEVLDLMATWILERVGE